MKAKTVLVMLAIGCLGALLLPAGAQKGKSQKTPVSGEHIFKQHCASCHASGGNRIKATRPVAGSTQLASIVTFKNYLSAPPGHMPYYKNIVGNQKILEALYKYCKQLKASPTEAVLPPGKMHPSVDTETL